MDRNLRLLAGASGLRSFGLTFVGPFAALYLYEVAHLSFVLVGVLLAAIAVPPLLWTPVGGNLADRLGRRPLLVGSLFGEAGAMAIVAVAVRIGSVPLFLAGFLVDGLLATTGGPALSAYVADLARGSDRTVAFTWLRIGTNIGFALGVASGGAVVGATGFALAAVLCSAFLTGGAVLVALRLDASPYDRAVGGPTPAPGRPKRPTVGLRAMARDRLFLVTCLAFALSVLVSAQWNTTYALFAHAGLGLSYAVIGLGFALNGVLVVVGQVATTNAVLGRRHSSIAIVGTGCYAVGFLLLGLAPRLGAALLATFFAATAVITLGENLVTIPMATLPSNLAPPEAIGTYNGVFGAAVGIGSLLATAAGGAALELIGDPLLLWAVLVVPFVPAALLLAWVGRRLPPAPNRA